MKKVLLLAAVVAVALSGCGKTEDTAKQTIDKASDSIQQKLESGADAVTDAASEAVDDTKSVVSDAASSAKDDAAKATE